MKVDLKHRLALLPLIACSSVAMASGPVLLGTQDMDRITAGAQSVLERLVNVIETVQGIRSDLGLGGGQLTWLTQLASNEPVTFRWTESGELVATQQLPSGGQMTIVKQFTPAETVAMSQLQPGDTVTTRLLQPGETLKIQQSGANGTNYLSLHSTGNSNVTLSQQHL